MPECLIRLQTLLAWGGGASTSAISGDALDATIKNYGAAQQLVQKSSNSLAQALLSKDKATEFEAKLDAANKISDPKEKESALNQIALDEQVALAKVAESKETVDKLKAENAKMKTSVANAGYNLALGGLKYADMLSAAKSAVSSLTANPTAAAKYANQFSALKDMVSSLPDSISTLGTTSSQVVKLFQSAGVKLPMPKSANDTPKASDK